MKITAIDVHHVRLPVQTGKVSLQRVSKPTRSEALVVLVKAEGNQIGIGISSSTLAGSTLKQLIEDDLAPQLIGQDARFPEAHFRQISTSFRGLGFGGLVAQAYSVIDLALWDLKAQSTGTSLRVLLGGERSAPSFVVSGMAEIGTDATSTCKIVKPLMEAGALGVVVDVGSGDVQQDADRVQQIRDTLGEDAWLGIRCDGRYDLPTALAMAHFYEDDVGIDWFESPLPIDDLHGYRLLAERMEVPLAVGSSFSELSQFRLALEQGIARVLRPDLQKLGGLTPLLNVCRLAEAYPVQVAPTRLGELSVHLAGSLFNVSIVEWTSLLHPLLANPLKPTDGYLSASSEPGIGWKLNQEALKTLAVS